MGIRMRIWRETGWNSQEWCPQGPVNAMSGSDSLPQNYILRNLITKAIILQLALANHISGWQTRRSTDVY